MGNYDSNSRNTLSVRKRVFELWTENRFLTAKTICESLGLNYDTRGKYVNRLLSDFRYDIKFGSVQRPHRRLLEWFGVVGDRSGATEFGWRRSKNRNRMLVFNRHRERVGSIHWYERDGHVVLFLRNGQSLGQAKGLFAEAFRELMSDDALVRCLDAPLKIVDQHWVFEVGGEVPKFKVDRFQKSHGLVIYADRSHPNAIEVRETEPFWLEDLGKVTEKLGVEIQEHLNLVQTWKREAERRLEENRAFQVPKEDAIGYTNLSDPFKKQNR